MKGGKSENDRDASPDIGIIHVLSSINMCCVLGKTFEHEASAILIFYHKMQLENKPECLDLLLLCCSFTSMVNI